MSSVYILGISNSNYHGTIPAELAKMPSVLNWYLQSNLLTGTVPSALGQLTAVEAFFLANNMLSGGVPPELGGLVRVRDLYMDANRFSGPLPAGLLSGLSSLEVLRFQRNMLTGDLAGHFSSGSFTALG